MNEIIPGIYRIPIPIHNNPLGFTNTYLVRGTDGYLLIDAGWNSTDGLNAMKDQLAELDLTLTDIRKIVITHSHGDHYGLVQLLRQYTDAEVSIHTLEYDVLDGAHQDEHSFDYVDAVFRKNGAPNHERFTPRFHGRGRRNHNGQTLPDTKLSGDETISTGEFDLQVIWTPGHAPGHICFYEATNRILFGGDHVLPGITPNISLMPHMGDNPLGDYMRSLKTLSEYEVAIVLPAHEEVYYDFPKRLNQIEEHHRQRNREIQETLNSGPRTAYLVSSGITWVPDSGGIHFRDLGPMHQRMALLETLAHLRAMVRNGEISETQEDGTVYFSISR